MVEYRQPQAIFFGGWILGLNPLLFPILEQGGGVIQGYQLIGAYTTTFSSSHNTLHRHSIHSLHMGNRVGNHIHLDFLFFLFILIFVFTPLIFLVHQMLPIFDDLWMLTLILTTQLNN